MDTFQTGTLETHPPQDSFITSSCCFYYHSSRHEALEALWPISPYSICYRQELCTRDFDLMRCLPHYIGILWKQRRQLNIVIDRGGEDKNKFLTGPDKVAFVTATVSPPLITRVPMMVPDLGLPVRLTPRIQTISLSLDLKS